MDFYQTLAKTRAERLFDRLSPKHFDQLITTNGELCDLVGIHKDNYVGYIITPEKNILTVWTVDGRNDTQTSWDLIPNPYFWVKINTGVARNDSPQLKVYASYYKLLKDSVSRKVDSVSAAINSSIPPDFDKQHTVLKLKYEDMLEGNDLQSLVESLK